MSFAPHYDFRERLSEYLVRDLTGPSSPDEVIEDMPLTRYAVGVLYAKQSGTIDPVQDIGDSEDDGDGENVPADPPVSLANMRYPSSMGLTFAVDSRTATKVTIRVSNAARYEETEKPSAPNTKKRKESQSAAESSDEPFPGSTVQTREKPKNVWKRISLDIPNVELDISKPSSGRHPDFLAEGLSLFCRVRPQDGNGNVPVTVVLLNERVRPEKEMGDEYAVFQSEIGITAASERAAFVERPTISSSADDVDLRSYRLLYRHAHEFAAGHGCSVRWDAADDDRRAHAVYTAWTPRQEVLVAESNPAIAFACLGMRWLANSERSAVTNGLDSLCDGYESWITQREPESVSADLDEDQRKTASEHLDACREAAVRIRRGVQKLREDDQVWCAFRLANTAMSLQRARTIWLKTGQAAGGPVEDETAEWRPFQLAFILLCLEGIVDPACPDREKADLLWFPTGGGKTEAYLGLIAFTVFLRRLRRFARGQDGSGVTALMRYTLRLLTIQQFERATLLICCLEHLRRNPETDLGPEPISIGLWLGQGGTPNDLAATRESLNKIRKNLEPEEGNPIQIRSCPWCGTKLDHNNYYISAGGRTGIKRMVITCRNDSCEFKDELPVHLIDEDVYNHRPTLIIATVDKFAGMPWRDVGTAALFNIQNARQGGLLPPELIIQDELHLISGPLGTLTGLYETAVDELCSLNGARPKVIASTATIRRSKQQGRGLFDRDMYQFPPSGLDARDSYFAVEAPRERRGSRLYLGLMAPGISHTTLLVRAYAALLQGVADLPGTPAAKDPFWTLTGYFNSLRVLGGARMQVQDDVGDRMGLLATSTGTKTREIPEEAKIEMTSRVKSGLIPSYLKAMAVSYPDKKALSVILATNMISVGVDIDRLGLMVVMGQPQATSEYIQATSRVGRSFPGLIVVLFNAARSRDRSHYESFAAYHSALYRQVEATSVTPFSARARDRGLHAVLVALARQRIVPLRANEQAEKVYDHTAALNRIKAGIVARVLSVTRSQVEADATEHHIEDILDTWRQRAAAGKLSYRNNDSSASLLRDAADVGPNQDEAFPTLWSLRDVDQETNFFFTRIHENPSFSSPPPQAPAQDSTVAN